MPPTSKQQAQTKRTGDGHPGDPAAKEQAQSTRPGPTADEEGAAPPQTSDPAPATADPSAHPQVVDLQGCARCRTNAHPGLMFHPLLYPIDAGDGAAFTHWAACPTNGEPILMRQDEVDASPAEVPAADQGTA